MKSLGKPHYKKHVLVCVNERAHESCCARVQGQEIYEKIKHWVRENHLGHDIWVTRTRCLGFCNDVGTTVVIYPDKLWFIEVTLEDVEKIIGLVTA